MPWPSWKQCLPLCKNHFCPSGDRYAAGAACLLSDSAAEWPRLIDGGSEEIQGWVPQLYPGQGLVFFFFFLILSTQYHKWIIPWRPTPRAMSPHPPFDVTPGDHPVRVPAGPLPIHKASTCSSHEHCGSIHLVSSMSAYHLEKQPNKQDQLLGNVSFVHITDVDWLILPFNGVTKTT